MFDSFDAGEICGGFPEGVLVVARDGIIAEANRAACELLGYEADDLVGRSVETLVPESMGSAHVEYRHRYTGAHGARDLVDDRVVAARHRNGEVIDVEITLVPLESSPGYTMAVIRDVAATKSRREGLEAQIDLISAMARGAGLESTMQLAARHAQRAVRADTCWIWLAGPSESGVELVARAERDQTRDAATRHDDPDGIAVAAIEEAFRDGRSSAILDTADTDHPIEGVATLGHGTLVVARIGLDAMHGLLVCARHRDRPMFDERQRVAAERIAEAIMLALEIDGSRDAVERLAVITDLERIARELHDTVIQRLFATGLRLEAAIQLASPSVADRLHEVVTDLNSVVDEIRGTIFGLQRDPPGLPLAEVVRSLVDDYAAPATLATTVRVGRDVDELIPRDFRHHALTALRECLANVVRHADATEVTVSVTAEHGWLTVEVVDDGVGPVQHVRSAEPETTHPFTGHGLRNLSSRAIAMGGRFTLTSGDVGGAHATWAVPLPARP